MTRSYVRSVEASFGHTLTGLLLLGALAVVPLVGCDGTPEEDPVVTEEWPQLDPNSKVATIDDSLTVDPPTVYLSKSAREYMQWKNDSGEDLMITFTGNGVGLVLPAGRVSYIHAVNVDADEGSYPYVITRPNGSRSPGIPDVNVGP